MRRFLKCRQVTVKCVLTRDSLNVQDGSYFMKVDQWRHNTANDGVPGQLGIYTREKRKTLGTGLHTEVTRGFFTSYTRTPGESERHDCTCNRLTNRWLANVSICKPGLDNTCFGVCSIYTTIRGIFC